MRKTLLLVVSTLTLVLAGAPAAQAWCGPVCLATLPEGKWVSDLYIITPSSMAIYSSRAWVVCKRKKQSPSFEHDRKLRRQRWLCSAQTI